LSGIAASHLGAELHRKDQAPGRVEYRVSELAVRRPPPSINRSALPSVAEIEVGSEAAKCECGLDQYEVRRWHRLVRSIAYQMTAARFPAHWDLKGFDFAQAHVDETPVRELYELSLLASAYNVVFMTGGSRPMIGRLDKLWRAGR
jgi:IstB-like ATP binding protein